MLRKHKFFIITLIFLLIPSGYFLYMNVSSNFHTLTPGEAYRSAQPNIGDIENYTKEYGIRSILNLRGENSAELVVCR